MTLKQLAQDAVDERIAAGASDDLVENLPVVAYADVNGHPLPHDIPRWDIDVPLVRLTDAQQVIDRLTRERNQLADARNAAIERCTFMFNATRDAQEIASKANDRWAEISAELEALKASRPDVDEVMALADEMVKAKSTADHANQFGSLNKWLLWTEACEAARSALRAKLEGRT